MRTTRTAEISLQKSSGMFLFFSPHFPLLSIVQSQESVSMPYLAPNYHPRCESFTRKLSHLSFSWKNSEFCIFKNGKQSLNRLNNRSFQCRRYKSRVSWTDFPTSASYCVIKLININFQRDFNVDWLKMLSVSINSMICMVFSFYKSFNLGASQFRYAAGWAKILEVSWHDE